MLYGELHRGHAAGFLQRPPVRAAWFARMRLGDRRLGREDCAFAASSLEALFLFESAVAFTVDTFQFAEPAAESSKQRQPKHAENLGLVLVLFLFSCYYGGRRCYCISSRAVKQSNTLNADAADAIGSAAFSLKMAHSTRY